MKITSLFFPALTLWLFVGCAANDEVRNEPPKVIHLTPPEWGTGAIPDEHPIHFAYRYTFREMHEMYKKDIQHITGTDYASNLKNFGFHFVMEKGLLKEGTHAEKKYYLDEQMAIDVNLLNLENFYLLLSDSANFLGKKKADAYDAAFYDKNVAAIALFRVEDHQRKEILSRLEKARALYTKVNY